MTPVETLARCPLFQDFTDTGLRIVASIVHERSLPEGAPIFVEGMLGDSLYVVRKGRVVLGIPGPDGKLRAPVSLGEGEAFGELSLVTPEVPRLVSAVAETPVELLEIRYRDFARLQTQKPQACLKLVLAIAGAFGKRLSGNRETFRDLLVPAARR
jgi:CRP/FNR family cyclic AMP-dependent transcriptional regulator